MTKTLLMSLALLSFISTGSRSRHLSSESYLPAMNLQETKPIVKDNWALSEEQGINVKKAWRFTKGSKDLVVAVVDTGVDFSHPQLNSQAWVSKKKEEKYKNKIHGWDFVLQNDSNVDTHGHGTHIAGIINSVAPEIRLSAYRYFIPAEQVKQAKEYKKFFANYYSSDSISGAMAIDYSAKSVRMAVDDGAKIINYSGGGSSYSKQEFEALKYAESKNVLVIVAAGNEYNNTDNAANAYYPCAYQLTNMMCVGSLNSRKEVLGSSNFGKKSVHIFAPGEAIHSTYPNGEYYFLTGTSQATAFVSGVAALVWSKNPSLTAQEVKETLMSSVTPTLELRQKSISGGYVNAGKALESLDEQKSRVAKNKAKQKRELSQVKSEEDVVLNRLKQLHP